MPGKGSRKLDAKQAARLRRHEIEAQKRQLRRRERRRTWLLAGLGVVIGGAIVAAVVVQQAMQQPSLAQRAVSSFGVSAGDAGCTGVQTPKVAAGQEIGPGSAHPKQTKGDYTSAPPVGGDHYAQPLPLTPHYYGPTAKPSVERLVKNEIEYDTVVWYAPSLDKDARSTLQQLAQRVPADHQQFLVVPWWPGYAHLPSGKPIAIATKGHVQHCAKVSGAVVQQFNDRYGAVQPANSPAPATVPPSGINASTGASHGSPTASPGKSGGPAGSASPRPLPSGTKVHPTKSPTR